MKKMSLLVGALRPLLLCSLLSGIAATGVAQSSGDDSTTLLPVVSLRVVDAEASEPGNNIGLVELRRAGPTNKTLEVEIRLRGTASNGVDYVAIPRWIHVPAGVRSVPIPIKPLDDTLVEGTETVELWLPPSPLTVVPSYLIGTPSNALVWIFDNDPPAPNLPPIVAVEATDPHAAEPGLLTVVESGEFTIRRTGPTELPLTVFFRLGGTASNGVDYVAITNRVVIPPGEASAKVMVYPLHDTLPEGTETVVLRLQTPACIALYPPPPGCYVVGTPAEAVVFIRDNDLPPPNRPPEVKLTRPLDGQTFVAPALVPIRAVTVDPDGYVPHIEFFANNQKIGEETRMFLIAPLAGEPIVYEMRWSNPPVGQHILTARAVDNRGASGWSQPVGIWVVRSNELPIVSITAPDAYAVEGLSCVRYTNLISGEVTNICRPNPAVFVIRRTGPTNAPLTVCYHVGGTASNGLDYVALPGVATIAAGRRATEIRVLPIDDLIPEPVETVGLSLRVPPALESSVPSYLIGTPARAAAVIVDNDRPRPGTGMLSDGCFHIMKPAGEGNWFRIDWTRDMANWTPLCTIQTVEGALHFVDPDTEDSAQRFYRAVPVAAPAPE